MDIEQVAMEAWLEGDCAKAEVLLLKAAENGSGSGSGSAAHNLGTLYAVGGPGVKASSAKRRKLYEQALASGFEETVATDPTWFKNT